MTDPAVIASMSDAEFAELYRQDWAKPQHVNARESGRDLLWREWIVARLVQTSGSRSVLDVGCGEGYLAQELCSLGLRVSVMDLVAEAVTEAAKRAGALETHVGPGEALLGSAPNRWDAVTCCETIEHVQDPKLLVRALWHAAKVCVVMTTPVGNCYDDPLHLHHWADEGALAESLGLEVFTEWSVRQEPSKAGGDPGRVFVIVGRV